MLLLAGTLLFSRTGERASDVGSQDQIGADSVADLDATQEPPDSAPNWASAVGQDEYGYWADFEIENTSPLGHSSRITQRMRWIPPGTFLVGAQQGDPDARSDDEMPQRPVEVKQGFWMFDAEVTQALWDTVMGENTSDFIGEQRPADQVTWEDAERFVKELGNIKPSLRLSIPTEAEWEYACRAGTTTRFAFGDEIQDKQARFQWQKEWKSIRVQSTANVKQYPPNSWGLYDMHGNVMEWCEEYSVVPSDGHKVRGGGWGSGPPYLRSAARLSFDRDFHIGLRPVHRVMSSRRVP